MIKLFFSFVKLSAFALIVLALGHTVKWEGKTLSQHIQSVLNLADRSPTVNGVKSWTRNKVTQVMEQKGPEISSADQKKLRDMIQGLKSKTQSQPHSQIK